MTSACPVPPVAGVKIQEHLSALAALGILGEKRQYIRFMGRSRAVQASTCPAEPLFCNASCCGGLWQLSAVLQRESQQTITEPRYLDNGHMRLELTPRIKLISAENENDQIVSNCSVQSIQHVADKEPSKEDSRSVAEDSPLGSSNSERNLYLKRESEKERQFGSTGSTSHVEFAYGQQTNTMNSSPTLYGAPLNCLEHPLLSRSMATGCNRYRSGGQCLP